MTYLFSLAVDGLELLKKAYSNNSTICHTLNYYIELIKILSKHPKVKILYLCATKSIG